MKQVTVKCGYQAFELVTIELPLYRQHPLDHSTIYERVNEDGSADSVQITERDGVQEIELSHEPRHRFDGSSLEYNTATGIYASSMGDFEAALAKAGELLAGMGY